MKKYGFTKFQWFFIQFVCWLVLMNSFILFEETIVDRSDLWKSMPGYRVGDACVWDLGASVVFAVAVFLIFKTRRADTQ